MKPVAAPFYVAAPLFMKHGEREHAQPLTYLPTYLPSPIPVPLNC